MKRLVVALFMLALAAAVFFALSSKRPAPGRHTTRTTDASGRLLDVTSPIDPSEADLELSGPIAYVHTGALAAWKAIPVGERLSLTDQGTVFKAVNNEEIRFAKKPDGTYTPAATGLSLSEANERLVLTDSTGVKHVFTAQDPSLVELVAADGEHLYLSYKPGGLLVRVQSSKAGCYDLMWTDDKKLAKVLDETTGTFWEYHYEGAAVRVSVARPVR